VLDGIAADHRRAGLLNTRTAQDLAVASVNRQALDLGCEMFGPSFVALCLCLGFGFTSLDGGLASFLAFGNPPQDLRCRRQRCRRRQHGGRSFLGKKDIEQEVLIVIRIMVLRACKGKRLDDDPSHNPPPEEV
jgi:hypothetical protein